MVLGLRSKSRKCVSVQVDYLVHVQKIEPWPSVQSSKLPQFLLIQWENGDQSSGSFSRSASEGKVDIGESYKLPVTLYQEASKKRSAPETFLKNCLEFQLYESIKEKPVKGQLLGSAAINLAEFGVSREPINISISINCKKILKNAGHPPLLYVSIEPLHKDSTSSSPKVGLYLDKEGSGSISALGDAEDEVEISSFTDDDDVSTHSSQVLSSVASDAAGPSLSQKNEEEVEKNMRLKATASEEGPLLSGSKSSGREEVDYHRRGTSTKVSKDQQDLSSNNTRGLEQPIAADENISGENDRRSSPELYEKYSRSKTQNNTNTWMQSNVSLQEAARSGKVSDDNSSGKDDNGHQENGYSMQMHYAANHLSEDELVFSDTSKCIASKQVTFRKGVSSDQSNTAKSSALKRAKSTFVPSAVSDGNSLLTSSHTLHRRDGPKAASNSVSSSKSSNNETKLESKVAMLEEELREAAALEVSLYSVVAEHGSSSNKLHSPARRLSRFYFHACQMNSPAKRASAARAVVSGLALVSKACGNDVPRLTFWLSNAIVLRAITSPAVKKPKVNENRELLSKYYPGKLGSSDDWENPQSFALALERVEAWMFSRIVESVWWQTMTPHMQSSAAKGTSLRKPHSRKHVLGDAEQGSHSIELWKKAFKDACERLCPVRAGGHECACLSVLARLVMEQLVSRLDVAMFNAILRESADDMPTDPVSDPITESKVLPIPAGKSGFAAGAQLKNAIGSWSRWLGDLFGIDEDDSNSETNRHRNNGKPDADSSPKAFPLLNALSDLMMLPFEMLADRCTREEVCPAFGVPLITRVLYNFVPDEFCPDPVPHQVFEALDAEDDPDDDDSIINVPYIVAPTHYTPPPASSLSSTIGDIGSSQALSQSKSSVMRKSYTSDDELEELDSPVASIILDKGRVSSASDPPDWMLKGKGGRKVVRYELLREVWKVGE